MIDVLFSGTLLPWVTNALTIQGTPQANYVMYNQVRQWNDVIASNAPDGKFFMLLLDRSTLPGNNAPWLVNTSPTFFLNSQNPQLDSNSQAFPWNSPQYANQPVSGVGGQNGGNGATVAQSDYQLLPPDPNIPIPPASQTGLRGNESLYDESSIWIFNAFYLKKTSQSGAAANALIGFEHMEDYYGDQPAVNPGCTYKSIGVRYSKDAGRSWTRSVPIITKGPQSASCDPNNRFTGTGDFATAWHAGRKQWLIYAQEGAMVLSVSTDPLARPGTWQRYDPVSGTTQPGFIGGSTSAIAHGDFRGQGTGSSASIIYDSKNARWQMVYDRWAGGLGYASSTDLLRWTSPTVIIDNNSVGGNAPNTRYPTLFGDGGDQTTSTGGATLWYGGDGTLPNGYGRAFWTVQVTF